MISHSINYWTALWLGVSAWAMLGGSLGGSASGADPQGDVNINRQVDQQTLIDPTLDLKPLVLTWPVDFRPVWHAALLHPESDLRSQAITSIRQAHRYGMPGLAELEDALRVVLQDAGAQPATRTAAAAALVELDCRQSAPLLSEQSAAGPLQLQLAVESGLAKWDYQAARELWLARLSDQAAHSELVRMAMNSLAKVGDLRAVQPLSKVLLSPLHSPPIRLTAARALGTLGPSETLQWSQRLMSGVSQDPNLDAQLGVELLANQSSPQAIELLQKYAAWPSAPVVSAALRRLLTLDPSRVLAGAAVTILDADANVREVTIAALAGDPSLRSIELLADALDDRVPELRRDARRGLLGHASDKALRPEVIRHAVRVFGIDSWRGLENAIIVLTELRHREIKGQLVPLVNHARPEVQITAAWAIKHLYEPDDGPVVLRLAQAVTKEIDAGGPTSRSAVQVHLHEALGMIGHVPAVEHLSKLIPKAVPYTTESRAASLWALGFLLKPSQDAARIRLLEARLADDFSVPMEYLEVRAAAAIALGRIADRDSLAELRKWYEIKGYNSAVGRSCGWAIMQMTGEPLPDAEPPTQQLSDWFIEPLLPIKPPGQAN